MWFKTFIDSFFWTFAFQISLFTVDSLSSTNFGSMTYSVFGFVVLYISIFAVIANLRRTMGNS